MCRCPGGVTGKETVKTVKMKQTVQQVSLLSFPQTVFDSPQGVWFKAKRIVWI